ncbi:ABC transporter permease [Stygiobacter electus]|uniref:ABC transporter permease n=1 Tax=Stygiobacter electus TaxID=3032292 RepID=A0AAE3TE46_9BACT|nr:ABC transporter permease [Stygiobacter electus]MDF1611883.1 ABC transporter permease [Stygiobacter electus]
MNAIKIIFYREIRRIIKDRNLITILLIAPIFYAFFYSSIYINKSEIDVNIVVVDNDNSYLSNFLIRNLDAHKLIKVKKISRDFFHAKNDINKLEEFGILYIPKNFEATLRNGRGTTVKLFLNSTRFLISNDINKSINEVINNFNSNIKLKYFLSQGFNYKQSFGMIEPIHADIRNLYNITESYGDFLIPAVLILILHQTLLIGLSESFAKEREFSTLRILQKLSNNSINKIIIGKSLFYLILYSSYSMFLFGLVLNLFKINFSGHIIPFIIITFITILSIIFFSIFISSFFPRKILVIQFLSLTSYPIFLISGFSWPQESLPFFLRIFSWLIPFTPYSNAFIKIYHMEASFENIYLIIIHLIMISILYYVLSYIRINHLIKKQK